MSTDRKYKLCPNKKCECHIKMRKYGITENYCSKCGRKLVIAKTKCSTKKDDLDETQMEQSFRENKEHETNRIINENARKVGAGVGAIGVAVLLGIKENVTKEVQRSAIRGGTQVTKKIIKKAVRTVLKKK